MDTRGQAPISPEATPWYRNYRVIFAPLAVLLALAMVPGSVGHLALKAFNFYAPIAFLETVAVMKHTQGWKDGRDAGS